MAVTFDVEAARAQFPALQQEQVFMDNAGGIYIYYHQTPCLRGPMTDIHQEEAKSLDRWWIRELFR